MQSATVTTDSGTLCASSHNASATPDRCGVTFDSPVQGPGWDTLTQAAGGGDSFLVTVSGPSGHWNGEFRCARADDGQVQMTQD
jgi:hypothetical protein